MDTIFNKKLAGAFKVKDLWKHTFTGTTQQPFTAVVPAHDVVVLRLVK